NDRIIRFFIEKKYTDVAPDQLATEITDYIKTDLKKEESENDFAFFSEEELTSIRLLLNQTSINNFNFIYHTKEILQKELKQLPILKADLAEAKSHTSNDESAVIEAYENNESILNDLKASIS